MRHGLTLGELGLWFIETYKLDVDYRIIEMEDYKPDEAPGYGWPLGSAPGSTQAPTRLTSGWRAPMPAR